MPASTPSMIVTEEKAKQHETSTPTTAATTTTTVTTPKENKRSSKGSKKNTEEKESKKDKKIKERDKDMMICDTLLSEMEKHYDFWPFPRPVNTKQFPTYKKIIKKPMDFTTFRTKLESSGYA